MRFLFIHQNFPAQFRHLASALADDPAHQVVGIGDAANVDLKHPLHPRLTTAAYPSPKGAGEQTHPYLRDHEAQIRRGQQLARSAMQLKSDGFVPDVIVVHPSWGEALFLREVFPSAKQVHYCEFFYHTAGADVGFDPEFPTDLDGRMRVLVKNNAQLQSIVQCDVGIAPTQWQRSCYPVELQGKIKVLHEGIDTTRLQPDANAVLEIPGLILRAGDQIVTFCARNLEPYRGFHCFMRALPELQARCPVARVIVVGGDDVSYGRHPPPGYTYRQIYCNEIGDRVDWSRVHFLGKLPYATYLKVLRVSAAHVYLTYPFVLSWSMLEAMACGCLVIGSATPPVREVISDGDNGKLVDFFDRNALVETIADVLADPTRYLPIRAQAREFVQQHYDLRSCCLPAWLQFLTGAS